MTRKVNDVSGLRLVAATLARDLSNTLTRLAAMERGDTTYSGSPCKTCKNTIRYTCNATCKVCQNKSRDIGEPK